MARQATYLHLQDPLRPIANMTIGQLAVWALFVGAAIIFGLWLGPWLGVPGTWILGISGTVGALPWAVSKGVSGAEGASVRVLVDLAGWLAGDKRLLPGAGEVAGGYVVERPVVETCGLVAVGGREEIEGAWD
jgi:hypothetical protein